MTKIAIIIESVRDSTSFIASVRKITNDPISAIQKSLHGQRPLIEFLLSMNDHEEKATILRALLNLQDQGDAHFRIVEFDENEEFVNSAKRREIPASTLKNILDAHGKGIRQFEDKP